MAFQYFLSEKEGLLVISLKGSLDGTTNSLVEKCLNDAISKTPAGIVLHLAEVSDFPRDGFRDLALLLRGLKAKCKLFRVTGLEAKSQKFLIEQGLISASETRVTLAEAAKEVAQQIKANDG